MVKEWEGTVQAPLGEPGNVAWHPVGNSEPQDDLEAMARQNTRGGEDGDASSADELERMKSRNKADKLVQG